MTDGRAIALIYSHGCYLLPSHSRKFIIVNERFNLQLTTTTEALKETPEEAFVYVLRTGKSHRDVKGYYRDWKYRF